MWRNWSQEFGDVEEELGRASVRRPKQKVVRTVVKDLDSAVADWMSGSLTEPVKI
jgi:hypothetical protein